MRDNFILAAAVGLFSILLPGQSKAADQTVADDRSSKRTAPVLQQSHTDANVPTEAKFAKLLERDLKSYFASKGISDPEIRTEPLRIGATQSGVSFPKFYFWVRVSSHGVVVTSGAVRVAAVAKAHFEVTDFMARDAIASAPDNVGAVFPYALVSAIKSRAVGHD